MGVEDDALGVALAVADAEPVGVAAADRGDPSASRTPLSGRPQAARGIAARSLQEPLQISPFRPTRLRSFTNTCSPRRSTVDSPSARFASWCGAPWIRRSSSPRWVRQHAPRPTPWPGLPPPRPSTRTADVSIVTSARADRGRSARAPRSAARRSPGASGPDHPPPGARSGRTGAPGGRLLRSSMHAGRPRAARALGAPARRWARAHDGGREPSGGRRPRLGPANGGG